MGYAVLSQVSFVMIPIAFYMAIARANLFDIDRVISATISFNLLAIGVIAGGTHPCSSGRIGNGGHTRARFNDRTGRSFRADCGSRDPPTECFSLTDRARLLS